MQSPRITALSTGAGVLSLLLIVTGCSDGDAGPEGDGSSEQDLQPLAGEGFLALDCAEDAISVARFSDEDGSVEAEHSFNADGAASVSEPRLPHGRTIDSLQSVELPECSTEHMEELDETLGPDYNLTPNRAHELAGLVVADESLLLVEVDEEIGGEQVRTIGAMSADGQVEALLPAADDGGFSGAPIQVSPRHYAPEGVVRYLEHDAAEEASTVKSLDLDSGDISDIGVCEEECGRLVSDPYSGMVYATVSMDGEGEDDDLSRGDDVFHRFFSHPDGSMVGYADINSGASKFHMFDLEEQGVVQGFQYRDNFFGTEGRDGLNAWTGDNTPEPPAFSLGDHEFLVEDDEFTIYAYTEGATDTIGGADESREQNRQLLPGNTRTNEHPVMSAEHDRVLFRSTDEDGKMSWFSVSTAGGEEPEEIGPVSQDHSGYVPIQWL